MENFLLSKIVDSLDCDVNRAVISSITHYLSHLEIENLVTESFEGIRQKQDLDSDRVQKKINKLIEKIEQIV